jgi:hypothetical protein
MAGQSRTPSVSYGGGDPLQVIADLREAIGRLIHEINNAENRIRLALDKTYGVLTQNLTSRNDILPIEPSLVHTAPGDVTSQSGLGEVDPG